MALRLELAATCATSTGVALLVTHDAIDALTLADRVLVLDDGRVAQVGPPARGRRPSPAPTTWPGWSGSTLRARTDDRLPDLLHPRRGRGVAARAGRRSTRLRWRGPDRDARAVTATPYASLVHAAPPTCSPT